MTGDPREGIMSRLLAERTILVGMVISAGVVWNYLTAIRERASLENARTFAVTTMVFFQFFQAWNSRSEHLSACRINPLGNPFLSYSMIAAFFAQLAFVYAPPLQWVFRTVPLTGAEWLRIEVVSAQIIVVVEMDKWLRRAKAGKGACPSCPVRLPSLSDPRKPR